MTHALTKQVTFDEFIAWYPENPQRRYELHDRVIVEIQAPTGDHEEVPVSRDFYDFEPAIRSESPSNCRDS